MKKIVIFAITIVVVVVIGIVAISNAFDTDTEKELTVGVIFNGSIEDKSWTQAHYEGLVAATQGLNLSLLYKENVPEDEAAEDIAELIEQGCQIIVATSFGFGEAMQEAAARHPDIYFFHATGVVDRDNLTTYFGRMYQIRYLSGVVAGLQTQTNEIGYAAAFPYAEVNRGINAFALGVRAVNPDAVVYVEWCQSWEDDATLVSAVEQLIEDHNIDVLTVHSDSIAYMDVCNKKDIDIIGYNMDCAQEYPDTYLTAAVWEWEKFYTPCFTECVQNKSTGRNYWEGLETGIVSLAPLTDNVAEDTQKVVNQYKERIESGTFDVFYGPIYDNAGVLRIAEGENMSDASLLNEFDWYVEGVIVCE